MTALKWITNEAKRLRRKYPRRFTHWKQYVAEASAIYARKHKGKSPVGHKRKKVSNVETRSKSHVDKNRMTTNIQIGSTASGNAVVIKHLNDENMRLYDATNRLAIMQNDKKGMTGAAKKFMQRTINDQKKYIASIKKNIQSLKRNIK